MLIYLFIIKGCHLCLFRYFVIRNSYKSQSFKALLTVDGIEELNGGQYSSLIEKKKRNPSIVREKNRNPIIVGQNESSFCTLKDTFPDSPGEGT